MGGFSSTLGVLFEIAADPSKAEEGLKEFQASVASTLAESQVAVKSANAAISDQAIASSKTTAEAMQRTIAESAKMQGATANQVGQIYKQLGVSGARAAKEIATSFGAATTAGQAAGAAGQAMGAGVTAGAAAGAEAADTQLTPAVQRSTMEIRQATASAMILERQLGIALPRGINAMIGRSELLGGILTKAFAIGIVVMLASQIDKTIEKIKEASLAFGGFGAVARKAFADAIEENNKLLSSFKDVKTGYSLEQETLRNAAALDKQKTALEGNVEPLRQTSVMIAAIALSMVTAGASMIPTLVAIVRHQLALKGLNDEIAKNTTLTSAQHGQLVTVTLEQAKLNLEIDKEKAAALGAGQARSAQLKSELAMLTDERNVELREATGNADKIAAVWEKYKWKRIQIEGEITKALVDEAAKQNKPALDALNKYEEMLGRLGSTYDSGNAAVKRYLETERQLGTLEQFLDTTEAHRLNVMILERDRTDAITKATEEVTRAMANHHMQYPPLIESILGAAAATMKLSDAERQALSLHISETNALARIIDNSKALTAQIVTSELPARAKIEEQIKKQMDAANRAYQQERQHLIDKKATTAELEALDRQYTTATKTLEEQRESALVHEGTIARQMFLQVSSAMLSAGINAIVYSQNIGQALLAAAKATLATLAETAAVHAIEELAIGFAWLSAWPVPQPQFAAMAFNSAALWGAISGASLAAAVAIPGGAAGTNATAAAVPGGTVTATAEASPGGAVAPGASTTVAPALAPGAASAAASQSTQPVVSQPIYITIQGDYLATPQAAHTLISVINDAVMQRDEQLHATRALKPAYAVK